MKQGLEGESKQETIHVNGLDLAYVDKGNGDPVIFIHGGMTDLRSWLATQIEPFSQRYRAIAYSRRSHYPNPWVKYAPDYSIKTEVKDLIGIINALGLRPPIHIVGSSLGGSIASFTALERPDLVRTLVLCEPGLFALLENYPEFEAYYARWKTEVNDPIAERLRAGDTGGAVTILFNYVMGKNLTYDQIPVEYRTRLSQNARTILEEGGRPHSFSPADAKQLKIPTLLVGGEKSPFQFRLVIEELAKYLPNCERLTIENASHGMHNENPQSSAAFNEGVMSFLAKH